MSEVVKFKKREEQESQEVLTFKTDLKMFMNFLDTVDLKTSRWAMANMYLDQTSVNFTSHYLDNLFESIKDYCKTIYHSKFKSVGLINHTLHHAVLSFLDWSEDMDTPVFEFNILTPCHDLTFTIVMLTDKQSLVTNITYGGVGIFSRLTSHIGSLISSNEYDGYTLTGGSHCIPEVEGSDINFGFYNFSFMRPKDKELIPVPITKSMKQDDFLNYLTERLYGEDFILLPMEIQWMVAKHPKFRKPISIYTFGDLYLASVLPVTELDQSLSFEIYTKMACYSLEYDEEAKGWKVKLVGQRNDVEFLDFIEQKINQMDIQGKVWETDGQTFWYNLPFVYNGKKGMVRWDRLNSEGTTLAVVTLIGGKGNTTTFNYRTVVSTTAVSAMLDANSGLLENILSGLNDYIE